MYGGTLYTKCDFFGWQNYFIHPFAGNINSLISHGHLWSWHDNPLDNGAAVYQQIELFPQMLTSEYPKAAQL